MTTDKTAGARALASRLNGARSRGPTTASGRRRGRRGGDHATGRPVPRAAGVGADYSEKLVTADLLAG
jgi:hypothetical protein